MEKQKPSRDAWIEHYRECERCHEGIGLCAAGTVLADKVMAGMVEDEIICSDGVDRYAVFHPII